MEFYFSPFHTKKTSTFSMLKLTALWSRSYLFTCALYHSTRYWISSLADLLHDIKFIHFNSAASLFTNIYLFICDLFDLKNVWVLLIFLRYFRVNMPSSVTVSTFFLDIYQIYHKKSVNYLHFSQFIYYVLGSSSIWTCRILKTCCFSTGKRSWKNQNKYSKFDTSKSIRNQDH